MTQIHCATFLLLGLSVAATTCSPSEADPAAGGASGAGGQECGEEICDGFDNDCDDRVDEDCPCDDGAEQRCYSSNPITQGIGVCRFGIQRCDDGWGECRYELTPQNESCDGLDNNCNGQIDDGVPCEDGGSPDVTCTAQYGDLPGYQFCAVPIAVAEPCAFTLLAPDSCALLCAARGGECLDAYEGDGSCTAGAPVGCDTVSADDNLLCVCSLGCDFNPPCPGSATCTAGTCVED